MKLGLITAIREDTHSPAEYVTKRMAANLAPLYLAGYLKKQGVEVEILIKDHLEDFLDFKPDIVGISSVTENVETARHLARQAKKLWDAKVLLGGVHITALPNSLPSEFDLGVVGEGEETLEELLRLFAGQGWGEAALSKVPGIVFRNQGRVQFTGYRSGIPSLDEIPYPARQEYIQDSPLTYMMTSRGCPYTCQFCVIPNISKGYRMHSPAFVVEEIKSIKTHYPKVKNIRIFDDLYIVNRDRVREIAERVAAEGLNQELSFGCWGRANLIDDEMISTFKKMNMNYVAFGAESGSSRVLSQIKPASTVEENQRAIDQLSEEGIDVACSIIMGHPLETEEDLMATYDFIERNMDKLFDVEFNVALPWPGTDLWDYAKQRGMVHEEMDFTPLKECADFPQYCTEYYPYLNEKITPERFDYLLARFKKLHQSFRKSHQAHENMKLIEDAQQIARYY